MGVIASYNRPCFFREPFGRLAQKETHFVYHRGQSAGKNCLQCVSVRKLIGGNGYETFFSCLLAALMVLISCTSLAEEWTCPSCESTATGNFFSNCGSAASSATWVCASCGAEVSGQFCNNCGAARDGAQSGAIVSEEVKELVSAAIAHTPVYVDSAPDKYTCYVEDYVGKNLASFGYTSMGGDRREYYGKTTVEFALYTVDGTAIDIDDEEELRKYIVVDQSPALNTEFRLTYRTDSDGNEYSNLFSEASHD